MTMSIRWRIFLVVFVVTLLAVIPLFFFSTLEIQSVVLFLLLLQMLMFVITHFFLDDYKEGVDALQTGLLNLKDGEYSTTLAYKGKDEFGQLSELYNETIVKLRKEKQWLYQRELLLDKITQSSPDVLVLLNNKEQVVFSNLAAREFFTARQALEGKQIDDLVEGLQQGFIDAIKSSRDGLFSFMSDDAEQQTWHLANGEFRLNGQNHRLIILKQMTREMSRQEVAVWKKVIRIISHELNNSLGPISSMLHSGQILAKGIEEEKLSRVFATIGERIVHLTEFVQGYGKFAKLPEPKIQSIVWTDLITKLQQQWKFSHRSESSDLLVQADPVQLEQLLINLLKNAHEAGGSEDLIEIRTQAHSRSIEIEVNDAGQGMSETVMNNALIPFYSTKSQGSGLGLALCREIVEAHHGQISLRNRESGGLCVRIDLPILE